MRITDFAKGAAWAIVPERFDELARMFGETQITDDMILRAEKEGALVIKTGSDDESPLYALTDSGAAVISIKGPLVKDPFLAWWVGGTTFGEIQAAIGRALDDARVDGIVLDMDSPGGTVNGTEETAEVVFAARGKKPIVAYSSGMMASAAYWIGSAAERVIVGKTAEVGSIGVLMVHRDWSRAEERFGVKTTYLTAGKYKALGNPSEPLSEFARGEFQAQLDQLYSMFVGAVALHRDTEETKVRADMAEGRLFIGERAVGAGLADETGNLQAAIDAVVSEAGSKKQTFRRTFAMGFKTVDEMKAAEPALCKQVEDTAFESGKKSVDVEPAKKEAAAAESERVLGLVSAVVGDELGSKVAEIVKSGISVDQYKAVAAVAGKPAKAEEDAEAKKRSEALAAIQAAGADNPGAGGGDTGKNDFFTLVSEEMSARKGRKSEAMAAVNQRYPEARAEMIRQANGGASK